MSDVALLYLGFWARSFYLSAIAGLPQSNFRCDRILLPVQPHEILEITLGFPRVTLGHPQPMVMRLALPPAAAVLTLMERSVNRRSGTYETPAASASEVRPCTARIAPGRCAMR